MHGIDELFLFAGSVVEPRIQLDRARVDFSALMLGSVTTETVHLVNHEHLPFSFAFSRDALGPTLDANPDRKRAVMDISPMQGLLPPNGRTAISIQFCPSEEKAINLNLACAIRKKPTPLNLNIKGEGYGVHARLLLEESGRGGAATESLELLPAPAINHVD